MRNKPAPPSNRKRRQRASDSQPDPADSRSPLQRPWTRGAAGRLAAGGLIAVLLAAALAVRSGLHVRQDPSATESSPPAQAIPFNSSPMAAAPLSPQQAFQAGQQAWEQGQAQVAERWLRQALQDQPGHLDASNRLAYVLGVEGRCWEAAPLLMHAVRQGQFSLHHLVLLGALEPVIDDPQAVALCRRGQPENRLPLVGAARTALKHNDRPQAAALLREVIAAVPTCHEAQGRLGGLLASEPLATIQQWEAGLAAGADEHPEIWMARGQWARAHQRSSVALRCFLQATRLDPNHRLALLEVGQLLRLLDQPQQAQPFLQRAERLRQLGFLVDEIYKSPEDLQRMRQAAELTESLGRIWEAHAWCQWAAQTQPQETWPRETGRRLQARLEPNGPRTIPDPSLLAAVDLSSYPLPDWRLDAPDRTAGVPDRTADAAAELPASMPDASPANETVAFADQAAAVGMPFVFQAGTDAKTGQTRMLDTTGGGVAVIDYDLDGWPDIYFTQSAPWPPQDDQTAAPPRDPLFRNLAGQQAVDVTIETGLGDDRYSQGATVGDFDNDGFADLYVANFGGNRLYRNNGDGTFSDVTDRAGLSASRWTTSCLIADLNGDGLPDLYDVNYLDSTAAAQAICRKGDTVHWCDPSSFDAEQDQLFLNVGDGRFRDVSDAAGIVLPAGKGLGIVAADLDRSGRLSLFVANDAVANFYFQNETNPQHETNPADPAAAPLFSEQALLSGLAFSDEGLPQGCMGIAAGDADGDGRLDLFVTNFYEQANALYLQPSTGQFVDACRQAGLVGPSFQQLGFGTQFLDGDLDGRPDLVVANGHVLDLSHQGTPYHMPPQYFQNLGNAHFQEMPRDALGPYFQGSYLGRGLAVLDWNRDGRQDFVVSNIAAPAALMTNQTDRVGHYITVHLRGVRRDRDALGAIVQVTHAGGTRSRQLTAGDGYQASNQRQLTFGLGTQQAIEWIDIRWPSGLEQTFHHPTIDTEWLFIEGFGGGVKLTGMGAGSVFN